MYVHHINCGTNCPYGGSVFDGRSGGITGSMICHCLVIETQHGLVLVDTGYGTGDVRKQPGRITTPMIAMLLTPNCANATPRCASCRRWGTKLRTCVTSC